MNASKTKLVIRYAVALGLLALAAPAVAENGSYGYFRVVEGSATLMQAGTDERSSAEINQPVLAGDRIWVSDRSRVEIMLADRNLLRLDGGSELALERLAASPDRSDRATVLRLLEGNLQLVVTQDSRGDELPRVETPNATIYPQTFGVYRITADRQGWSEVVVRRGTAEVVTDHGTSRLRADEKAIVDSDRYTDVEIREAGGFDPLERWSRQLDDDYASADVRYVDDSLRYSAAPLARHGSWIDVNGSPYWRPRVASGWRPYWQGRWSYTPAGLTWISSEPWGWVPYHYGSWDYLPSYGWAWAPGHVWSPAWVYWYWGPSYVGWCPTGYYTGFYGPRFGHGFGFRYGVYGWAGGDWGHFHHWNFIRSSYFGHHGHRGGHRDGFWDGRRDVHRYAVPIDSSTARNALERGIITTDTKPLRPSTWTKPDDAVRALSAGRNGPGGAELPDVTSFIARKPDLPATVARTVRAEGNTSALDGTPLKPSTLGRIGSRRVEIGGSKPGDVLGDDGQRGAGREAAREPMPHAKPVTRPESSPAQAGDSSDTPRRRIVIERPAGAEKPQPSKPSDESTSRARPGRPAPEADGGAPRPSPDADRGGRTRERDSSPPHDSGSSDSARTEERRPPVDRQQIQREIELRRQAERPRGDGAEFRSRGTDLYERPDRTESMKPAARPESYRQPEPRALEPRYRGPEPSRRPDPPRYESGGESQSESRSEPRMQSKPRSDSSSARQAQPPARSHGDQGARSSSQSRQRQSRPRDDG